MDSTRQDSMARQFSQYPPVHGAWDTQRAPLATSDEHAWFIFKQTHNTAHGVAHQLGNFTHREGGFCVGLQALPPM